MTRSLQSKSPEMQRDSSHQSSDDGFTEDDDLLTGDILSLSDAPMSNFFHSARDTRELPEAQAARRELNASSTSSSSAQDEPRQQGPDAAYQHSREVAHYREFGDDGGVASADDDISAGDGTTEHLDVFQPLERFDDVPLFSTLQVEANATASVLEKTLQGMWTLMEEGVKLVSDHNQRQWDEIYRRFEHKLADLRAVEVQQERQRLRLEQFISTVRGAFQDFLGEGEM
ncbi:hypothetical protein RI367_004310 [Sorochytrium milnesiophthora]